MKIDRIAKAFVGAAMVLGTTIATQLDDGVLTSNERWVAVGATITAFWTIWGFTNVYLKALGAALVGVAAAIAMATKDDKVSAQEYITIAVAFLLPFASVLHVDNETKNQVATGNADSNP